MNTVLLQSPLTQKELGTLFKEFPYYFFLNLSEGIFKKPSLEDWKKVEVLFGNRLSEEDFSKAEKLRWIHSPTSFLNQVCVAEVEKRGNVIITNTKEENITQIGEYAMGAILAFSKQLFHWKETAHKPVQIWSSKWRDQMWTLENKTLLQIGLGKVGTEIARRAVQFGMKVIGIHTMRTFHPYCGQTFAYQDLPSLLPQADIISLSLPRGKEYDGWFNAQAIHAIKPGSILMIIGSYSVVDEEVLFDAALKGHFRGLIFDTFFYKPIPSHSKLWSIPHILITPEVAPRPRTAPKAAFRSFHYNLIQYSFGNYSDMKNRVEGKEWMELL